MKILSSCKANADFTLPCQASTRYSPFGIPRFSLPFESFKNREHPLLPDRIKVGSVRPNTIWSLL